MLIGSLLLVGGLALVLWGAERFTDGAVRTAARFSVSTFYVGAAVSGFEPENLVTGVTAAAEDFPRIALGTVIGSSIFMLTGGLGVALLMVPMEVRIPGEGGMAMLASLVPFAGAVWNDGTVSRIEGAILVLVAIGLMVRLYRSSPIFRATTDGEPPRHRSDIGTVGLLIAGVAVMLTGAELVVHGVRTLLSAR